MLEKVSSKKELPDDENRHHLFNYYEIRHNLMQIMGKPRNDAEEKRLHQEISSVWRIMPKYRIKKRMHEDLHKDYCEGCGRSHSNFKIRLQGK